MAFCESNTELGKECGTLAVDKPEHQSKEKLANDLTETKSKKMQMSDVLCLCDVGVMFHRSNIVYFQTCNMYLFIRSFSYSTKCWLV